MRTGNNMSSRAGQCRSGKSLSGGFILNLSRLTGRPALPAFLLFAVFLLFPIAVCAQEPDTLSFNALEFSMQKRYRPGNAAFVSDRFTDNTFLRVRAGSWSLFGNSVTGYSLGPSAGVSLGKMFSRFNGLSTGLSLGEIRRNTDGVRVWHLGADVSHIFDLTSYFYGYNPSRILSVSTVEGLELDLVRASGSSGVAARVHLGIDFRARVSRDAELFFRPDLIFGTDMLDRLPSPRNCHGGYAFNFGVLTHFNRSVPDSSVESFAAWLLRDAFVSVSGGVQFQASELVRETVGFLPSARECAALSYGRLLTGPLSFRLSAFYGRDIWKGFSDGRQRSCFYGGVRGELMFDPMFWYKGGGGVFSMPLMLGPEACLMIKPDDGYTIRRLCPGVTGGLQFRFNISRHFGLFLEPRFSVIPYSWKSRSGNALVTSLANWYDAVYSLQLGVNVPL